MPTTDVSVETYKALYEECQLLRQRYTESVAKVEELEEKVSQMELKLSARDHRINVLTNDSWPNYSGGKRLW